MELADDLSELALMEALPGRPARWYPALLSTDADAQAWARQGAPAGAVVVAGYQASPRGRAGLEWHVRPRDDLAFSLIVRVPLRPEKEGWLYTVAATALSDVVGNGASIEWPDEVRKDGGRAAAVGVTVELGPEHVEWAVVNVLISGVQPPRTTLLARTVDALETRLASAADAVLKDYLERCDTIGRHVRARLIPLGPGGLEIAGKAVGSLMDGALLIETQEGKRVAVRPQSLGLLDEWDPDQDPEVPSAD